MSQPYIAQVQIIAENFAPRGYAFCDGQILPIAQNTALFSLVGTIYGGDGRTTYGLPNLKGRPAMHPGRGPGLTERKLGQVGGSETETLSLAQMASHSHRLQGSTANASFIGQKQPADALTAEMQANEAIYAPAGTGTAGNMATESLIINGGTQAHDNMQPYLTLNFIIALTGTFPSRS